MKRLELEKVTQEQEAREFIGRNYLRLDLDELRLGILSNYGLEYDEGQISRIAFKLMVRRPIRKHLDYRSKMISCQLSRT